MNLVTMENVTVDEMYDKARGESCSVNPCAVSKILQHKVKPIMHVLHTYCSRWKGVTLDETLFNSKPIVFFIVELCLAEGIS